MGQQIEQKAIPILDMTPEIEGLWDELNQAIQGVLRSGHFIMGPNVSGLEGELARYLGTKHAIAVNSGTDALVIGLRALGIGAGDEVITTSFTFFATAEAVSILGATPIFVDVDPVTYNLDVAQVEAKITPRTRAIIPVHLFGQAVDMDAVMALATKHGLKVLEDVAQAFGGEYKGKKVGTIGHLGAYSFFPSKNLGTYGDGGLMTTDDDKVAEMARMLRVHGAKKKYYNEVVGYNSRLDELQAAILRVKLPHIDEWNDGRRRVAARYTEAIAQMVGVMPATETMQGRHVYHQYTLRVLDGRRDAVKDALEKAGVNTMVYYPVPVHKLPIYAHTDVSLPVCEQLASQVLSLPIWPTLDGVVQEQVLKALEAALRL